jgi:hypothetical protein
MYAREVSPVDVMTKLLCECFEISAKPCRRVIVDRDVAVVVIDRARSRELTMHPRCAQNLRLTSAAIKMKEPEA